MVRFTDRFFANLVEGLSVKDSFVRKAHPGDKKHLWLDDTGDAKGHSPEDLDDDGDLAAATYIGVPGTEDFKLTNWVFALKRSPGELRVYDSHDRVTGLVNGEVKEEIPNSVYNEQDDTVAIFSPSDTYRYQVVGTGGGTYGLELGFVEGADATIFIAIDIPTSASATHQYAINWDALSQGKEGVTVKIDENGDGIFERTITSDSELTGEDFGVVQTGKLLNHGPNPIPAEGCIFWLNLPDDAVSATLKIFDIDGALLISIPLDPTADRYPIAGRWIPEDDGGRLLGTGLYLYLVEIEHTDGSTSYSPVQKMVIKR